MRIIVSYIFYGGVGYSLEKKLEFDILPIKQNIDSIHYILFAEDPLGNGY